MGLSSCSAHPDYASHAGYFFIPLQNWTNAQALNTFPPCMSLYDIATVIFQIKAIVIYHQHYFENSWVLLYSLQNTSQHTFRKSCHVQWQSKGHMEMWWSGQHCSSRDSLTRSKMYNLEVQRKRDLLFWLRRLGQHEWNEAKCLGKSLWSYTLRYTNSFTVMTWRREKGYCHLHHLSLFCFVISRLRKQCAITVE